MLKRRNHHAGSKTRLVLEAVKVEPTVSQLPAEYDVHSTMIHQWKKALLEDAADIFERGSKKTTEVDEDTVRSLHAKIGELAVADDFCQKGTSRGAADAARHDRTEPSSAVDRGPVPPALDLAVVLLLRAAVRDRNEPLP